MAKHIHVHVGNKTKDATEPSAVQSLLNDASALQRKIMALTGSKFLKEAGEEMYPVISSLKEAYVEVSRKR